MAHKVEPNQRVLILGLEIAVPAEAEDGLVRDEISARLSLLGTDEESSCILDWRYTGQERIVQVDDDPEEGAVFCPAPESRLTPAQVRAIAEQIARTSRYPLPGKERS
jgi:hypothetical protein